VTADAETWARRIDPEIRSVLDLVPHLDLTDIPAARRERAELAARAADGHVPPASVRTQEGRIPGWPEGEPDVVVRVHEPAARSTSPRPALLWVHGGGHVMGAAVQDDPLLQDLVARTGCVAVAVEWRRAPEDPYPAAVYDAYAALLWMAADPALDPERLVVGGASSGGGAAAGLALLARDRAEVRLAGQVLVYPMLDDREVTASSREVRD
jgi:acetyl esterase/lipase